jgi:GDPmannose 4,6-dehydratase
MKVAFITGITGQDGSYLAELLLEKNYKVYGLKRRISTGSNTQRIDHLLCNPNLVLIEGDMNDSGFFVNVLRRIKFDGILEIYNLAAISHVKLSFDIPEYTAKIDSLATLNMLEAIRNLNLENNVKFYQASTSELYGKVKEIPQNENTQFNPCSPYAISKLFSYWMCRNYREAYGMYVVNGILFNHESPRRNENFVTRKITKAVANIRRGGSEILCLGDINPKRDWGHAKDYVLAMWLMMQQERSDDYVVATGKTTSVKEFVELAFKEIGITILWRGKGIDEVGVDSYSNNVLVKIDTQYFRPCEVDFLLGDASKMNALGWKPTYSLRDIVKEMVEADQNIYTY